MSGLKIGELAREAGVPIDTVRYYEKNGLLPAPKRTPSGYRAYDQDAVRHLRFIRNAKRLGFTLQEIAQLLELRRAENRAEVRQTAQEKIDMIDVRIAELTELRTKLGHLVRECADERHSSCPILDILST